MNDLKKNIDVSNIIISISPFSLIITELFFRYNKHYNIYCSVPIDILKFANNISSIWNMSDDKLKSFILPNYITTDIFKENKCIELLPTSSLTEYFGYKMSNYYNLTNKIHNNLPGLTCDSFEIINNQKIYDLIFVSSDIDRQVKGFGTLIKKIYENTPKLKKVLIGTNSNKYKFENTINLELTDNKLVNEYMSKSKIVLIPSLYDVGPTTFVEAIISGSIPLISTNCGYSKLINKKYVVEQYIVEMWLMKIKTILNKYDEYSHKDEFYNIIKMFQASNNRFYKLLYKSKKNIVPNVINPNFDIYILGNKETAINKINNYLQTGLTKTINLENIYLDQTKNIYYINSLENLKDTLKVSTSQYAIMLNSNIVPLIWKKFSLKNKIFHKTINRLYKLSNIFDISVMRSNTVDITNKINSNIYTFNISKNIDTLPILYQSCLNYDSSFDLSNLIIYDSKEIIGYQLIENKKIFNEKIDLCIMLYQQFQDNFFEQLSYYIHQEMKKNNKKVKIYINGFPQSNFKKLIDSNDIIIDDISNFESFIINNNINKIFIPYCPFVFYPEKYRSKLFDIKNIDIYIFLGGIVSNMHQYSVYKLKKILSNGSWFKDLYKNLNINQIIYPIYFCPTINDNILSNFSPKTKMKKNYCCIGRFSEEKRQMFLIEAFNDFLKMVNYDDYHLYLIGACDSVYKDAFIKKINELNLNNNVHMIEWMNQNKLFNFLKENIDYHIITSVCEGLSSVLLETMALCIPTLSSNVYCVNEIIKNNYNGITFEYHNYQDIMKKKLYLIPKEITIQIEVNDAINKSNFCNKLFEIKDDINLWNKLSKNCEEYIKHNFLKNNKIDVNDFFYC